MPSADADVSQRHWQPSELHLLGGKPKANIEDTPLHISAHSTSVENLPMSSSDPLHSVLSATRLATDRTKNLCCSSNIF